MSEPFLAEIRIVSFEFAPKGWAMCNGQFMPINQNQALFALLGATYGGDGRVNFALPNFRGRMPVHVGNGHVQGERGGGESHTLNIAELPDHTHALTASSASAAVGPSMTVTEKPTSGTMLARATTDVYGEPSAPLTALAAGSVTNVGGSQPHQNMQPYLVLNFVIALQGIFPSPN